MSVTTEKREGAPPVPLDAQGFRTAPDQETTAWPPGIPYIIGNEACERFSFYGMRAILTAHLAGLYMASLHPDMIGVEPSPDAWKLGRSSYHLFVAANYALPMLGAILADRLLGKYRTIFYLSLVYCLGHAVLSVGEHTLNGMFLGLALVALGAGGIKPCVSANVGDQFGRGNWFRVRTIYQIFYFSINFGSFFATLLIPWVRKQENLGPAVAFGIPGVLMFLATVIFWMGRRKFVHVPPKPGGFLGLLDALSSICLFMTVGHLFFAELEADWVMIALTLVFPIIGLLLFSYRQRLQQDTGFLAVMFYTIGVHLGIVRPAEKPAAEPRNGDAALLERHWFWRPAVHRFGAAITEGPIAVLRIISVFFLISIFWALFDQHGSSWVEQASKMDLTLPIPFWKTIAVDSSQVQAMNPLLVMLLIPLLNVLYAWLDRSGIQTTPLRRITLGMFFTSSSFAAVALIQQRIDSSDPKSVWFLWQLVPYLLITIGEIMVSITGLEFAYTQAPKSMKSTIMGFWLLTVALGNVFVALLGKALPKLELTGFFWLFAGLSAGAAVLFGIRAIFYTPKDYPQE